MDFSLTNHVQNILVLQVIATNYVSVRKRAKLIPDHTGYRNCYKSEVGLYVLSWKDPFFMLSGEDIWQNNMHTIYYSFCFEIIYFYNTSLYEKAYN